LRIFARLAMKTRLCCLLLVVTFVFQARMALSQVTTATIYGTVVDSTGALVPGATVTVVNDETSGSSTVTSGSQGEFTVTFLGVGVYTVSVQAKGFKNYKRSGLQLAANQRIQVEAKLEVGDTSETISVSV
jgi:hypothetical protein